MAYFVRIRGKAFGPFDETQLKEMKSKGKLGKTTEVSENKMDWQQASELDFLFPPAAPAPQPESSASAPSPPNSTMPGPPQEPANWFYSANGTEGYGPVTHSAILQMLRAGTLQGESLVWQQGQNARPLKSVQQFFSTGTAASSRPPAFHAGETTETGDEQTGAGNILQPLAASLGWLMFLKITYLFSVILMDLSFLGWAIFMISHAIGADSVQLLLLVLLYVAVNAGLCVLATHATFCFWRYHTDLHRAVVSGRESDLLKANHSQARFWKWFGILVASIFAFFLLFLFIAIILAGFGAGNIERLF